MAAPDPEPYEMGKGGTHGCAPLTAALTLDAITLVVNKGRNDMPPFGAALSSEQMQDLTAYVLQLASKQPAR